MRETTQTSGSTITQSEHIKILIVLQNNQFYRSVLMTAGIWHKTDMEATGQDETAGHKKEISA